MVRGMLLAGSMLVALLFSSNVENYYWIEAKVIYQEREYVEVVDSAGKRWGLFADEIKVGDSIKLKFDENHTVNRGDDIIVDYTRAFN